MSVSVHKEDDRLPTKEPFMGGEKEWLIQRGTYMLRVACMEVGPYMGVPCQ